MISSRSSLSLNLCSNSRVTPIISNVFFRINQQRFSKSDYLIIQSKNCIFVCVFIQYNLQKHTLLHAPFKKIGQVIKHPKFVSLFPIWSFCNSSRCAYTLISHNLIQTHAHTSSHTQIHTLTHTHTYKQTPKSWIIHDSSLVLKGDIFLKQ